MANSKLVLVTGVTGKQGGAVARALIAKGHRVRGMTRNVESDAARAVAALGVDLVAGDFRDSDSLAAAVAGVDTVFAMGTPFEAGEDAEIAQGVALVDAAVDAEIDHFVYTSVASADKSTGIPHFDSKWEVEKHLASTALDWSVIAPVYFMENLFFGENLGALQNGSYPVPLPLDLSLQQVAVADIGAFGALVVDRKDDFVGRRVEIASDESTSAGCAVGSQPAPGPASRALRGADGADPSLQRGFRGDVRVVHRDGILGRYRWPADCLSRGGVAPVC